MKRKLSVIFIILIMLGTFIMSQTFAAAEDQCKISVKVTPNTVAPGGNVIVNVSVTEMQQGIVGVMFGFEYDDTIFEISQTTPGTGWTYSPADIIYFLNTTTLEATTQTGTLITFNLKVKNGVSAGTETELKFTSIQVTTDNGLIEGFRLITKDSNRR